MDHLRTAAAMIEIFMARRRELRESGRVTCSRADDAGVGVGIESIRLKSVNDCLGDGVMGKYFENFGPLKFWEF